MVDIIFYWCVDFLAKLAAIFGTTYEWINILIFIIGYPVFVLILFLIIYFQNKKIKNLIHRKDKFETK